MHWKRNCGDYQNIIAKKPFRVILYVKKDIYPRLFLIKAQGL